MPRGRPKKDKESNAVAPAKKRGQSLAFKAKMFLAADKLRKNLEPKTSKSPSA
jgi:type I restriction enzyme M protein